MLGSGESRRRAKSRRRVALPAWIAAIGALALLLARFAEPLLVHHVLCEHGELVHAAAAPTRGSQLAEHEDSDGHHGDRPVHHSDRHEHCDALAVRHLAAVCSPVVAPATLLAELPYEGGREAFARPPLAPLLLAPKTSPPTV